MNKLISVLWIALAALLLAGCQGQVSAPTGNQQDNRPGGSAGSGEGRAVFTITDAAADMGSVSSIEITVDQVMVHSQTDGWVAVTSTPETYDLLELKAEGRHALLADTQLQEGAYNQMRLDISNVMVTDGEGTHEATLPSGQLRMQGELNVQADSTSSASFDFIADESLHVTGEGEYILAPVVQVETRERVQAEVQSQNRVQVTGGTVRTNARFGMDAEGNVGVGLKIPAQARLEVGVGGVRIDGSSGLGVGLGGDGQGNTQTSGGSNASGSGQAGAQTQGSIQGSLY